MLDVQKLKDIREDHDLSQKDMANILKVNRSTYSLWELGINIIPIKYLSLFADYFNYSIDYILGITNQKESNYLIKGFDINKLATNLKEIRLENGLSQENIATILGVSQPCIARYEKGLIEMSTSNLYRFSKEFNVSISKLCGKEREKRRNKLKNIKVLNK
ncbi:MAG: helix-turn-helix domain-containing protein [Bacilli bacterium]|nr:helix-turn-helix domain-containing protein [Bacilli bacterium]